MKKKEKDFVYSLLMLILKLSFKLWYNPKIINKKYLRVEGPIIMVGNHKHASDQYSIMTSTNRIIHYMAKKEYFDGEASLFGKPSKLSCAITKWIVNHAKCIPVDRNIKDEDAKGRAIEILNNGGAIGLFPEGTRNTTDAFLLPFKFGAVSMASKTNATIIPFGITGDYKFRSKNLKVRFGKPFKVGKMSLEDANKKLEKEVEKLMRENLNEK